MEIDSTRKKSGVHVLAVFIASLTFLLLVSGGLVTSHGAGLTVPDWPNSFGYNMFAFPYSRWLGGIFFEHSHRLIATFVGLFTAILAIWLWARDTRGAARWMGISTIVFVVLLLGIREMFIYLAIALFAPVAIITSFVLYSRDEGRLRWLGMVALFAVTLQGMLGGLRVVWLKDQIGIFHAMLAQSFFVFICILAVMTSRRFQENRWADFAPDAGLRKLVLAVALLIFLQLGIAATMRHEHIGLSIPDFPLAYGQVLPDTGASAMAAINTQREKAGAVPITAAAIWIQMTHRFVAVLIFAGVLTVHLRTRHAPRSIRLWSAVWLGMICVQIGLGAWTIWSNKAADVATTHMALGALSLLVGAMITFRLFCGARTADFILPDAPNLALIKRTA